MSYRGVGLPGDRVSLEGSDKRCEGFNTECSNVAEVRVQGDTDSFGAEYMYLCSVCSKKCSEAEEACRKEIRPCDWCKKGSVDLAPSRDPEEGSSGPVYEVCGHCRKAMYKAQMEELSEEEMDDAF